MTVTPTSFAHAVDPYKVVFFDAYGVLKNSRGIIPGVADTLLWLLRSGRDLYVVTNDASKSPDQMAQSYVHPTYGPLLSANRIISSGLLAKDFFAEQGQDRKGRLLGQAGVGLLHRKRGARSRTCRARCG